LKVTITGIEDVNHILATIAPREAKNILRSTTAEMAKQLSKDAKPHMPNDPKTPTWVGNSFTYKRERGDKNTVAASAIVDLSKDPKAFIWRFHEYGQGPDHVESAMYLKAFQAMKPNINAVYIKAFTAKLMARLKRAGK
jgi:hypothetical protein